MDYYTGNSSLGHYTEPRSRDSTFSQSSESPSLTSQSPSLNQRPRAPPDFTSNNRLHMPNPTQAANPFSDDLLPPTRPFGQSSSNRSSLSSLSSSSQRPLGGNGDNGDKPTSLSVNYLPTKFSRPHSPGIHPRRIASNSKLKSPANPIRGGGLAAFRSGEARMPGSHDEDYDGVRVSNTWGVGGGKGHRPRWNRFKWIIFTANVALTIYSMTALVFCLMTWLKVWDRADVVIVANSMELILSTVAASVGTLTALLGWAGILLNNRSFLAVYTLFLWVTFGLLVAPGYVTYKTRTFNLEGKINAQWSRKLGASGRLRVQDKLECCGYYSPFVEATVSQTCYARSLLPGCKLKMLKFQRMVLSRWYSVAFGLVPLQIAAIFAGLLCSNHVTYRFGKGMMPKAYRLSLASMAVIMDNYAQQLADQYGDDVASDVLSRSRNKIASLSGAPPSPLTQSFNQPFPQPPPPPQPQPQSRVSGVDARGGGYAQPQPGYSNNPPVSYPFAAPAPSGSSAPTAGAGNNNNKRYSTYTTYGSSVYRMSMLGGKGPNEQGGYDDGRRI